MLYLTWFAALAMAIAPFAATAQQRPSQADPSDPAIAVAPLRYESAFHSGPLAEEADTTPDQVWRAANDEMGKLGGHSGHMKQESGNTAAPTQAPSSKVIPPQGSDARSPGQPASKPAVDHSKHH